MVLIILDGVKLMAKPLNSARLVQDLPSLKPLEPRFWGFQNQESCAFFLKGEIKHECYNAMGILEPLVGHLKKDSYCLWNKTFTDKKHHFSYWKISCHLECFSQNQLRKLSSFVAPSRLVAMQPLLFQFFAEAILFLLRPCLKNGEVSLHVSRLKDIWSRLRSTNHPFWIIFCIPVVLCFFFWWMDLSFWGKFPGR